MNVLSTIESVVSKLGYPKPSLYLANTLIEDRAVHGYQDASIGRNCIFRGEIHLGENVKIADNCDLRKNVRIGKFTNILRNTEIFGNVNIGKYSAVARNVTFQQKNHQIHKPSIQHKLYRELLNSGLKSVDDGPINVGNDVWIGTQCIILSGVTIGDGAIIGAGSVVTNDVAPYEIVGGTPAKNIGWRFTEEVREELLDIAWWDWDENRIVDNSEFFDTELDSVSDIRIQDP